MFKHLYKKAQKSGLPPGTLSYIGEEQKQGVIIELVEYAENYFHHSCLADIADSEQFQQADKKKWLIVKGIHDTSIIEKIGDIFNINSLTLEDIVSTVSLPKVEFYDNYVFILLKLVSLNEVTLDVESKQVSIILGKDFLLSFQEDDEDLLVPLKKRLENGVQFQKQNLDYLCYAILDLLVDLSFHTLVKIGNKIEDYEDYLLKDPSRELLSNINDLKGNIIMLRSIFRPLKNLISALERFESPFISRELHIYLRDVNDHINQLCEIVEIYREMTSHLMDVYLSSANNKMSEIMKILTIMASIFIPLTFIAGIYGMNFEYMPELKWHYGYYTVLGVMGTIFVGMVYYFWRKKWF